MSADQLADRLGKNRATIYRYESGDIGKMSLDIIEPLARILCVSPAYLMGWEKEKATHISVDGIDSIDAEIVNLLSALSTEQKKMILAQLRIATGRL